MTTATKRAAKGGEFGANGEWYEGGKFINTVPEVAKKEGSNRKGARKQEIAPYVWVASEVGQISLYRQFAGAFGKVINGVAVLTDGGDNSRLPQILNYVGLTMAQAQDIIDRWNAGQRWA